MKPLIAIAVTVLLGIRVSHAAELSPGAQLFNTIVGPFNEQPPTPSGAPLQAAGVSSNTMGERIELSRARAGVDWEYWKAVRRSRSIKTYTNWPEGSLEFRNRLLKLLLSSGYSIDQLYSAWFALNIVGTSSGCLAMGTRNVQVLKNAGASEAEIENKLQALRAMDESSNRDIVADAMRIVGDEETISKLLAFGSEYDMGSVAAPTSPAPMNGEPMLSDDLWLTDELRKLAAEYKGPTRRVKWFKEVDVFPGALKAGNQSNP